MKGVERYEALLTEQTRNLGPDHPYIPSPHATTLLPRERKHSKHRRLSQTGQDQS